MRICLHKIIGDNKHGKERKNIKKGGNISSETVEESKVHKG